MNSLTINIPNERAMSWNKLYSGQHWFKRMQEAQRVHDLVHAIGWSRDVILPFQRPVHITITAGFKGRALDPDNICAKLYIDGLRFWAIDDDGPDDVASVTVISQKSDEPFVKIEVREQNATRNGED